MNKNEILFEKFMFEKKTYCEPATIDYYQENLEKFIAYVGDQEITKDIYLKYIVKLRESNIRNISLRTYCRAVKVYSIWLYDNGYYDYVFTQKVKLPRPDQRIILPLSDKEVCILNSLWQDNFFYAARNKMIVKLMLELGLRRSEVINLSKFDIDLDNMIIKINKTKFNKSRLLPIPASMYDDIINYQFYSGLKNSDYFICNIKGGQTTKNTIKKIFSNIKKVPGLERLHPHLLRHTFATSYIYYGGDLEKLRILLGHSDYNVTRKYLHISSQMMISKYPVYKISDDILNL